jgi:hypothetical protein
MTGAFVTQQHLRVADLLCLPSQAMPPETQHRHAIASRVRRFLDLLHIETMPQFSVCGREDTE